MDDRDRRASIEIAMNFRNSSDAGSSEQSCNVAHSKSMQWQRMAGGFFGGDSLLKIYSTPLSLLVFECYLVQPISSNRMLDSV